MILIRILLAGAALVAMASCTRTATEAIVASNFERGFVRKPELIAPGAFILQVLATDGSMKGGSTSGDLVLLRNHDAVVAAHRFTPKKPIKQSVLGVDILYGAARFNHKQVGMPICDSVDCAEPPITSCDPLRPGVLVSVQRGGQLTMLVSTLSNIRDGNLRLDGHGIGMWVTHITPGGFCGSWRCWGNVCDGSGLFCARRSAGSPTRLCPNNLTHHH